MLTGRRPVLQVHPTRRCNLACAHCYTSSGPGERSQLPAHVLAAAIVDAAELGYRQLAVSGGEPFLYQSLGSLLATAKRAGMTTTVTTNGMLATPARLKAIAGELDFLAISVDGPPTEHNLMRRNPRAFDAMHRHLADLRATDILFGFIFTLTRFNAHHIEWLVDFAVAEGAAVVQVHPLTSTGRAGSALPGAEPDDRELLAAMVEIERLWLRGFGPRIRIDAVTRDQMIREPAAFVPKPDAPLTELAPTLVVDDQGLVVPLTHDLDRSLAVGSLADAGLAELVARWRVTSADRLTELLARAYESATGPAAPVATYWYDVVGALTARARPRAASTLT